MKKQPPPLTADELFARNVRILRKAAGMTQDNLASRMNLDRARVADIERQRYPTSTLKIVDKLAKALRVEAFKLIMP